MIKFITTRITESHFVLCTLLMHQKLIGHFFLRTKIRRINYYGFIEGMTTVITNIESQNLVYKYLERSDVLYEFLQRAKENILGKHIYDDIVANNKFDGFENIEIKSNVIKSTSSGYLDIYVVISFNFNKEKTQFGHTTFHLIKHMIDPVFGEGPMHVGNDRGDPKLRRWKFRVAKKVENNIYQGITFSIGSCAIPSCHVQDPIPQIVTSLLKVINQYFDPANPLSLTNKMNPSIVDPLLTTYVNEILTNNVGRRARRGGKRSIRKSRKMKRNRTLKYKL
jgi:hypothetical protein